MRTEEIEVVREVDLTGGYSTQGIIRYKAFESEDVLFSRTKIASGMVSDWHHHAARHLYGFVLFGHLNLEYGPKGSKVAELKMGEFFHIPPALVHRDVNPDKNQEAMIVNILVGKGTPVVNVQSPEP